MSTAELRLTLIVFALLSLIPFSMYAWAFWHSRHWKDFAWAALYLVVTAGFSGAAYAVSLAV